MKKQEDKKEQTMTLFNQGGYEQRKNKEFCNWVRFGRAWARLKFALKLLGKLVKFKELGN